MSSINRSKSSYGTSSVSDSSSIGVQHEGVSDSRRRQSKRDDAIRRKIESDLSKKRRGAAKVSRQRKATPGTVLALKPSEAVTCKPSTTVFEASQLMTAKRENCILVVGEDGELLGIFTAKDLAFRVVGSNLNANVITIDQIMTPNPLCTNANDPASDALTVMIQKRFRHLPVLDNRDRIVGVLDITKCYSQQMEKLERMHESSKRLYEAFDTVHSEMAVVQQPLQVFQYFEELKSKMNGPTLDTVLDSRTVPIYCSIKTTVYEATVLMKENNTTAVLVKDNEDKVNGIFTSKDVVLRVIAAGLTPKNCSIVRVMTPQPDVARHDLSIQESLRKMFDGHYLNLPVVGDSGDIIGIVEVLKLTYATLNQIKQVKDQESPEIVSEAKSGGAEGPAWNKFWTSLDNDADSVNSDSLVVDSSGRPQTPTNLTSQAGLTSSDLNLDIKPSDSISHIETPQKSRTSLLDSLDESFVLKFKSPANENRVHRISIKPTDGLTKLRELIDEKLHPKDFQYLRVTKVNDDGKTYAISYVDDEGDIVSITSDNDLLDCVKINLRLASHKANLYLHNPHEPAPIENIKIRKPKRPRRVSENGFFGVPNEVLIPGVLLVLATATLIGYSVNKR
ncbi:hypothetical protein CANTEDRAFT_104365 [Yamadazyma tenuis ATCC 10573]|uniref:CBS-domain-containing protein n=2 Tax=Candida tenuis TaxID=2315449 RepID=G3B2N4_CANTC|nr:uncharacterized protein CANTEDRAFT_104365 [Yamadazyma tenuis ATCC 10573]EGV64722.1 hypothetical protein CANTEDRAFT_104365 [Yamadazyma tenuis ATCC 10573]